MEPFRPGEHRPGAPGGPPGRDRRGGRRFTVAGLRGFVDFLQVFLVAFGAVAVFVGAFTICNTLSITVAQRSRELALLQALGATRRQVLRAVVAEALLIGVVASAIQRWPGLASPSCSRGLLASFDVDSSTETVFATRIHRGAAAGRRARHACRRARSGAARHPRLAGHGDARGIPRRGSAGVPLFAALVASARTHGPRARHVRARDRPEGRLALLAPGALLLFVAVALISPRLVPRPSVLGRPGERLAGVAGEWPSQCHAQPGPHRGHRGRSHDRDRAGGLLRRAGSGHARVDDRGARGTRCADRGCAWAQDGWSPIGPEAVEAAAEVPGVEVATGIAQARRPRLRRGRVGRRRGRSIAQVFGSDYAEGSDESLAELGSGGALVTEKLALTAKGSRSETVSR